MPYRRPAYRRRRPAYRRRRNLLATRPRFIPRTLGYKRQQGIDTKVFYFKTSGTAVPDAGGLMSEKFNARKLTQTPGAFPQFTALKAIYDQFKCLAIKVRFFPANVGIEPHDTLLGSDLTLIRGNTITWIDQRADDLFAPLAISEVINDSSMRMHNSRRSFSCIIYRGKGFTEWASIQNTAEEDSWNGSVNILTTDASPAPASGTAPILYFWTASYKVVFRGRRT